MSTLREAAEAYLVMRRTLGFKLTGQARILREFIGYCEAHAVEHLTRPASPRPTTPGKPPPFPKTGKGLK